MTCDWCQDRLSVCEPCWTHFNIGSHLGFVLGSFASQIFGRWLFLAPAIARGQGPGLAVKVSGVRKHFRESG